MKLFEKLNNARKNKKGFTLVELIVVIIILAILAAILIPSFLGYMNKAQNSQKHIQARSVYLAASTVATEKKYDVSELPKELTAKEVRNGVADDTTYSELAKEIQTLVGTDITGPTDVSEDVPEFDYTITFYTGEGDNKVLNISVEYKLVEGEAVIPSDPSK